MKIAIISSNYPRKGKLSNGVFIHQQAKALVALGGECHIIQPVDWFPPLGLHRLHSYWKRAFIQYSEMMNEYEGIKIHHPKVFKRIPSRFFKDDYWTRVGISIAKYILSNKELKDSDLIYAHFLCYEGFAGTFVKKIAGIPLVAIARGDDVHIWPQIFPGLQLKLKKVFLEADLLLANSHSLASDTKKWMEGIQRREVEVIYNGIDYKRFIPVSNEQEKITLKEKFGLTSEKYFICVATPVVLKGWLELLDAIALLHKELEGWKLLMVAPLRYDKDALDLLEEARKRGINDSVKLLTQVSPALMPELMRSCDVFVLPSYNEGMANSLLEAMASGMPCIVTDVGGHREVIDNGENGLLISPKSVSDLVEAIRRLIGNEQLRSVFGTKARQAMLKFGDYHANSLRLYNLFKMIIR